MPEHLIIETPEQISLELPLAGIGSRFLALAFDTLIQALTGLVLFLLWIALGALGLWHGSPQANQKSVWTTALLVLAAFLVQFGYFAFFESVWNGQTPGKRYLRLRVIRRGGQAIGAYEAVARNLLRIVDSLPGIYAVGILCALLSSESKRLGDYVAGTVVVYDRPLELIADAGLASASREAVVAGPLPAGVRLSSDEFLLIESFLLRRHQLSLGVRDQLARQIVHRIASRLGITLEYRKGQEALLEELANAYRA
jgi:uncharacterized RDD family membrane protein YckC